MADTTALAPSYESRMTAFKESWQRALPIIQQLLPAHVAAERIFSVAVTARQRNPLLLECSDISVLRGIIIGAQLGLDVSGVGGKAYLIPYGKEAQFQVGYRGLMELARRTGQIGAIYGDVVYEGDDFIYENGLNPVLRHVRKMGSDDPGKIVGAWAVAVWTNGFRQQEVMSKIELDRVRAASRAGDKGPWVKWYDQMALKTVIKRLCKKLPDSAELQRVIDIEDRAESGQDIMDVETAPLLETSEPPEPPPTRTEQVREEIKKRGPGRPPKVRVEEPAGTLPEPDPAEVDEAEVDDTYEP